MLLLFFSSFLLLQGSLGGRTITELRTKTGTASGAGCDCKMEVAVNTPQVRFGRQMKLQFISF